MNNIYYWFSLPFCFFLAGYFFPTYYFHTNKIETPNLVGKQIHEAIVITSHHNLNPRIIEQNEEPVLPEGTILHQTPHPGEKIKPHQTLFLVTAKKPAIRITPYFLKKPIDTITKELANSDVRIKIYHIPHVFPKGHCFAQFPKPQKPLEDNTIILYVAAHRKKIIIWPDFTNKTIEEVSTFLHDYDITPHVVHNSMPSDLHSCSFYRIIEQRPLAGFLFSLDNTSSLHVQLRVQKQDTNNE